MHVAASTFSTHGEAGQQHAPLPAPSGALVGASVGDSVMLAGASVGDAVFGDCVGDVVGMPVTHTTLPSQFILGLPNVTETKLH